MEGNEKDVVGKGERQERDQEETKKEFPFIYHPLLNDVILKSLIPYVHPGDLPTCRTTCHKWNASMGPRFKKEFTVDLSGPSSTAVARKYARFIYAMPNSSSVVPFDSFKLSDTQVGVASLDRVFLNEMAPNIRRLQLVSRNRNSSAHFWTLLRKLERLEELELGLDAEFTSFGAPPNAKLTDVRLERLRSLKWIDSPDVDDEEDQNHNGEFLNDLYEVMENSLQHLELPAVEAWKHLLVFNTSTMPQKLNSIQLLGVKRNELDILCQLSEKGVLHLKQFRCLSFATDVQSAAVNKFLNFHNESLERLQVGWTTKNRVDTLNVSLNIPFPLLQHLSIRVSSRTHYAPIDFSEHYPQLKELNVKMKDIGEFGERVYFWEDMIRPLPALSLKCLESLQKLELIGVPLRSAETLHDMMRLFPNVSSLTLGRPSKHTLLTLWDLWPELKELKILSACPHIDEVLTGIPYSQCRKMLLERSFNDNDVIQSCMRDNIASVRNLKKLQYLEINGGLHCRLHTLSCLPSDMSVFFAFMQMPELRRVRVYRSLISSEACFALQRHIPSWGTVKVEQIRLHFDESVDAFQFHRNNQRFMKLLCGYPHQSLHQLPSFLTSLWVNRML